ncbi:PepSY domain-containing protein [Bacillus sp. 165]|uniref:PepSY domain-containing protein n=1 Tax=Bacillus sp. 165 TaxID=1529117 RepID=UPI001ADBF683|nr:PepSY domain-containing protein [Bacillus sp. 165]MBO9131236.1 PepSY domain-containing protein [Bacillus sp. 165]
MNWKSLFAGLGLGLAAGYIIGNKLPKQHISAEKALNIAKRTFSKKGEITGSWIHMVPEVFEQYDLTYDVYRGGITAIIDGVQNRLEFLVDSSTGAILEVKQA